MNFVGAESSISKINAFFRGLRLRLFIFFLELFTFPSCNLAIEGGGKKFPPSFMNHGLLHTYPIVIVLLQAI